MFVVRAEARTHCAMPAQLTWLPRGCPLKQIGDHLGHRSPHATRTYAKVDLAGLREVADFSLKGLL
jgi:hypothetical protein